MPGTTEALEQFVSETADPTIPLLQAVPAYSPSAPATVRGTRVRVAGSIWRGARAVVWAPVALVACLVLQAYWRAWPSGHGARSFGASVCVRIRL
jgi:hypothetical protein